MRATASDWATVAMTFVIGGVCGLLAFAIIPFALSVYFGAQFPWYAARASGMVAYLLATGSVVLGIATSTRLGGRLFGKANVADTHRSLSLLMLMAIGAHTLFLALDSYSKFTASELFVPFVTSYRPVWTGLGIIAAYMALAVYASFYIRPMIGYKTWRAFHYLAFAVFGLGTVHGLLSGSDSGAVWALGIDAMSVGAVALMLAYRIATRRAAPAAIRRPAMDASGRARMEAAGGLRG